MTLKTIVLCHDFAHIEGGAGDVCLHSAIGLARAGQRVIVFSAVGPVWPELLKAGVEVHCLNQPDLLDEPSVIKAAVRGIWNQSANRQIRKLLAGLDPAQTVVHIHGWIRTLSASIFPPVYDLGFKMVFTLHSYELACPTGTFFDHGTMINCHRNPMSFSCLFARCDSRNYLHKLWRYGRNCFIRAFTSVPKRAQHIIYQSKFSNQIISPHLSAKTEWHIVPPPIKIIKMPPVKVGLNKSVLQIGRTSKEKGVLQFAKAAVKMGVDGVLVGDGTLANEIRRRYPAIHITGWLDLENLNEWLSRARVVVVPSLCYETFGLVVHEALARGIPVLVASGTAASEHIEDGVNGIIFDHDVPGDLESKLALLSHDDDLVKNMGQCAHDTYWNNPLTPELHTSRLLATYEAMLEGVTPAA